ncbi:hypothetical protein Sjap_010345 [Stephania japonica]|uniref:Small auxin up regulated protein n=1 Tax=Stephania japonica TaxID=461633 RepID=A0AAP0JBF5_9MAGN
MKRFIIPTEYLSHRAFGILLREAEEEFGFQHEGVLRIPCEVHVFEKILKLVEEKKEVFFIHEMSFSDCSSEAEAEMTQENQRRRRRKPEKKAEMKTNLNADSQLLHISRFLRKN